MNIYENSVLLEKSPDAVETMLLAFTGVDTNIPEEVENYLSVVPLVRTDGLDYFSVVINARDAFLSESDWVSIRAVDKSQQSHDPISIPKDWLDYRKALRDITEQAGFPYDITWPTEPER